MAEPFETLREVGVALSGFRDEVAGQFTNVKWLLGGMAGLAIVVAGALYAKVDKLEEASARNTAILERIEAQLDKVALDTGAIKESVQTASAAPSPSSLSGWIGAKVVPKDGAIFLDAAGVPSNSPVWIFTEGGLK
jgi:hypothetical protein